MGFRVEGFGVEVSGVYGLGVDCGLLMGSGLRVWG